VHSRIVRLLIHNLLQVNLSVVHAMYELQGWADLPDGLLHSIVALLCSFPDLHAFSSTSRSWRAAFSSYPCKSTLLPPLLLQPNVPVCSARLRPFTNSLVPKRSCYVTDLANQGTYMCCQVPLFNGFSNSKSPPGSLDGFSFGSVSYGHLILSNQQRACLVVDVFTGVSVSAPTRYVHLYYAALTAPLAVT
jgi:hypothetical protein